MKARIEIAKDGSYWVHSEPGSDFMVVGTGATIEEAKEDFLAAVNFAVNDVDEAPGDMELSEQVEYVFDMGSFSEYFSELAGKPTRTPKQRATLQASLNAFGRIFANFAF